MNNKHYKQGVACAILCAVLWGILPIYWKSLQPINPLLIILYRIVLVGVFSFVASMIIYKWEGIKAPFREKGVARDFFFAGLLISTNWSVYIWAVSTDHIIETCIGYYIEPLFVCLFGVFLFKEVLNIQKKIALMAAGFGVLVMILYYGEIPLIALTLAVTFAMYAALKRKHQLTALIALLYETLFLMPFALALILYMEFTGRGAYAVGEPYQWALLSIAGIITGVPLMLFAMAANRINLVSLGLTEYISPSLTLLLGIFLYKEPFDAIQLVTFVIIWVGLIIFTLGEMKSVKEERRKSEGRQIKKDKIHEST
ncbi:MAG: EamA family transporter RarD [Anaerovorax sp.]